MPFLPVPSGTSHPPVHLGLMCHRYRHHLWSHHSADRLPQAQWNSAGSVLTENVSRIVSPVDSRQALCCASLCFSAYIILLGIVWRAQPSTMQKYPRQRQAFCSAVWTWCPLLATHVPWHFRSSPLTNIAQSGMIEPPWCVSSSHFLLSALLARQCSQNDLLCVGLFSKE